MADIHANGKMTAKITVGTYSGMNRSELDELLSTKADVEHTHDEYLTQHQDISHLATKEEIPSIEGLASEEYVNNAIDAIPEVDLSNCATKEELNEVKSSVSNGKSLLASAITDKGVETLATDSFETMANNIGLIQSDDIDMENPYYIEYRVASSDYALNGGTTEYKYGLPRIYSDTSTYSYTYEKVEIELNDGTITDDLNTKTKDVYKIRLWYPENTVALKFYGSSTYNSLINIVDYIKTDNFTDMSYMFYNCRLAYIDMNRSSFDTSNVTDMSYMFCNCSKLTSLDLSNFNTSKVTSMGGMFSGCSSLTSLDLSNFNTSNVTAMSQMFSSCESLTSLDLSNFNTSNVTAMYDMFYGCGSLTSLDLSNWNTSNVTAMQGMFQFCNKLTSLDLSNFNTSNVTNMNVMFQYCASLTSLDLSNFNTSNVTNMSSMFDFGLNSKITRLIIHKWDMNKTTSYGSLFGSSLNYIQNLKYIDLIESDDATISKIVTRLYARTKATYGEMLIPESTSQTIIDSMSAKYWKPIGPIILPTSFQIASSLDEIVGLGKSTKLYYGNYEPWYSDGEIEFVSSDDTIAYINENNELVSVAYGSVDVYGRMKVDNSVVSNTLTIDVSETDSYPNVIKFRAVTTSPGTYNYIKVNGNNVKLTDMSYNSISKIYTYDVGSPITTIRFNGYGNISYGKNLKEIIKLNTSNVTDMSYMFDSCSSLTSLDLSNWDTSNVTNMNRMFNNCESLTSLDLSNFDTSNVTNMEQMFRRCKSLTSLDLSNFNTSKVTNMSYMLSNIPKTVDWHYDGTNYQNFTLTESQTDFSGTFPW